MKKCFIIFVFLSIVLCPFLLGKKCAMAENIPSYKIAIFPEKYKINKSEDMPIAFYFSGQGNVKDAKISIYTDTLSKLHKEGTSPKYGAVSIIMDTSVFQPVASVSRSKAQILKSEVGAITEVSADGSGKLDAKHKYYFSSAYAGEHTIQAILTYKGDNDIWYTTERTIQVHVNSFLDKHLWWLTILAVIIGLIGLFSSSCIFKGNKAKGELQK